MTNASHKRACAYSPILVCSGLCSTFVMRCQIKKELSAPFTAPESFLSFYFRTLNSLFAIKIYSVVRFYLIVSFE